MWCFFFWGGGWGETSSCWVDFLLDDVYSYIHLFGKIIAGRTKNIFCHILNLMYV